MRRILMLLCNVQVFLQINWPWPQRGLKQFIKRLGPSAERKKNEMKANILFINFEVKLAVFLVK